MIERVVVVGLAAGYLTWLLVENASDVPVWRNIVLWWAHKTKDFPLLQGKPLTCATCMSFWLSVCLYGLYVLVFGGTVEIIGAFASASISLWYVVDLNKRNTLILTK